MEPTRIINTKPAAALLGGYVSTIVVGLLHRYAGYDPSLDEAMAIVGICSFGLSWLVPEGWWKKAQAEEVAEEAAKPPVWPQP